MKVNICEEEALFNNPNTEKVSVGKTGRVSICLSLGGFRFERFVRQGSPVSELQEVVAEGARYIEAMLLELEKDKSR